MCVLAPNDSEFTLFYQNGVNAHKYHMFVCECVFVCMCHSFGQIVFLLLMIVSVHDSEYVLAAATVLYVCTAILAWHEPVCIYVYWHLV